MHVIYFTVLSVWGSSYIFQDLTCWLHLENHVWTDPAFQQESCHCSWFVFM